MTQRKKLQVFVSSTYIDLQEERQAAVQAILTLGHIPAGMELFSAGDETQMNVIKRWIDESDVYMLILGGRYGSIEPKSQKSYIHLEYEYALERGKPVFSVVIDNDYLEKKVKKQGTKVIEVEYPNKFKDFRELVCSKMVRFWSDPKDIKICVLETMADFGDRPDLVGWIPGNESINIGAVAEELAKLTKENSELREKISKGNAEAMKFSGLTFSEMSDVLKSKGLSDILYSYKSQLALGLAYQVELKNDLEKERIISLAEIGLLDITRDKYDSAIAVLSEAGKQYLAHVAKAFNAPLTW